MSEEEQSPDTEQPQEPQEAQEAQEQPQENPLFQSLFDAAEPEQEQVETPFIAPQPSSLTEALHDIELEPEVVVADEEEKETVEENTEQQGEPPEAAKPKKKSKKVKQVLDPEIPVSPEVPVTPPAFSEETEEQKILKDLIPEEKEYYDMAKFASDNMEDHKGLDKEFLDYFSKSKNYVEKRLKDDPYADLSEDFEYKEFVEKNRPKFSPVDAKKIERAMITRQAEAAAEAKVKPEVERLRREQEVARLKPKVDQKKAEYRQQFHKILPEDAQEVLAKEGVEALEKQNPIRYKVMNDITTNLLSFADTFQDITSGLVAYDETNQMHTELLDWVKQEQDHYINTGDTAKDGKTFMRRERFYATPEDQRTKYFTWSDDDLMVLLVYRAQERLKETLKYQETMLEKAGYTRQAAPAQVTKPQQPAPAPTSAPDISPAPRVGQQEVPKAKADNNNVMSILGM